MATGNVTVNITARYVGWQSGRWHEHRGGAGHESWPTPRRCVGCYLNVETVDGPRYVKALRGAQAMRATGLWRTGIAWAVTTELERRDGIPAGTYPAIDEQAEWGATRGHPWAARWLSR